jgi:hypothetical protein
MGHISKGVANTLYPDPQKIFKIFYT